MSSITNQLRRQLESACKQARRTATKGSRSALESLAVHESEPYPHMDEAQRDLRRKLRAQAKQLGDAESPLKRGAYEIHHLVEKLAYDQWHRLLFSRFLFENNLLISPEHGVSVTLDDCEELAPSLGLRDAWAVAAQFAANELPDIFRADDPAGVMELPIEDRNPLVQLVNELSSEIFTASDSLGWCYQFWQAERKKEIDAAGNKIGPDELPAVTQLFTEDYMVDFLLDNTLGAWHAGKVLAASAALAETAENEQELRDAMSLPGCPWTYLRFVKSIDGKWTPASGTYELWPKTAAQLSCLDPCMGSGHFVVAMFERLVALHMAEGKLSQVAAVKAVIRDNLFGLEIDPRCTQISAFNLALAAWRLVGHCKLPALNLACSGLAPNAGEHEWLAIAADDQKLRNGMEKLYWLFSDSPVLGSLINPRGVEGNLLQAAYGDLHPLLEKALAKEIKDESAHEMAVTAQGLAAAAELLAGSYTLVVTNVPYLGRGKQNDTLKQHLETHFPNSKADLATAFVERCIEFCANAGTTALVTPQNWISLGSYRNLRSRLLRDCDFDFVAQLGPAAFQDMNWWGANTLLIVFSAKANSRSSIISGIDVSPPRDPAEKASLLRGISISEVDQLSQLRNPDNRIIISQLDSFDLLDSIATFGKGSVTGDGPHYIRNYWEFGTIPDGCRYWLNSPNGTQHFGGRDHVVLWQVNGFDPRVEIGFAERGQRVWGQKGVAIAKMNHLHCTRYQGELFDDNLVVLIPKDMENLAALWMFCTSTEFKTTLRIVEPKMAVTAGTFVKIPCDLSHWRRMAAEQYPHGLPEPLSNDPTQWLFNGHPKDSVQPLHVAVARLLGYQWPHQIEANFDKDVPPTASRGLPAMADEDGIVCLSAIMGKAPAYERLRGLLVHCLGQYDLGTLISRSGPRGSVCESLEDWLRDEFFEQHCAIFQQRPFIWHIWDGLKSGFSALVNYHKLNHANLERLTYAYLGDWLRRQQASVDAGESGSDARLQAAKELQVRLKLILEGEPPHDLFVRWKPLSQQPIGWYPDLNDGIRINIRPFVIADVLRKRVKIRWDKDRGKESARDKTGFPWFWNWDETTPDFVGIGAEPDGNRWNNCHYANEFKRKAREAKNTR